MARRKAKVFRRPPEGSLAWVEWALTQTEAALFAAEHDVGPLAELVRKLKTFAAWELVFADEPRDWERLVCERIDPRYRRTAWIDALTTGYFLLRESGEKGRLTRRAAERAAGWTDGPWVDLKSEAVPLKDAAARPKNAAIISKIPTADEVKSAVVEAVAQAVPAAVAAVPAADPKSVTVVLQKAEDGLKLDRIQTPDPNAPKPDAMDLLKSFWEASSREERERFAAWTAERATHPV